MDNVSGKVSRTRRSMIVAAAVMPMATKATAGHAVDDEAAALRQQDIVISGRLVDADGAPVAGARVELGDGIRDAASLAVTDADGRFVSRTRVHVQASGRPASLAYRVRHGDSAVTQATIRMVPTPSRPGQASAHRDEDGTWRAAFGIRLA